MAKIEIDGNVRRLSDLPPLTPDTGILGTYNSIALPLVRRQFPKLLANSLVDVVPTYSVPTYSSGTGNAGKGRKPRKQKSLLSFNPKTQRKLKK